MVEAAQAQVAAAEARLSFTKRERDRGQQLSASNTIPRRELDQRVNAYREAEAKLRAARAALESTLLNLSYTQVRATVEGRVGKMEITDGKLEGAGPADPVRQTLVAVSRINASFDADEQHVRQ